MKKTSRQINFLTVEPANFDTLKPYKLKENKLNMRLVQIQHEHLGRRVAIVLEPKLIIINGHNSIYELARTCIEKKLNISNLVQDNLSDQALDYDTIYDGTSEWQLLPSFDHPSDVTKLMLAGTGLTHKASAENRQKMHKAVAESELTDSMKMYMMGVEDGHPEPSKIGVQPEWFYKGNGSVLKAHNEYLSIPLYGDDGGEEPEVAGVYIIDSKGKPWRIGFTTCNEFSDHVMERKNYLYLAPSKIRNCAIGPELVIMEDFKDISGKVSVLRDSKILWEQNIKTGEDNMSHSLNNLEYHHFKYNNHCIPHTAHIHFFGADAFSFGDQNTLEHDDTMIVEWQGMGRPIRNRLQHIEGPEEIIDMGIL
jgi:hypothetical protein